MLVELMTSGTIISIRGGDIGIKLDNGKIVNVKKSNISFSISIGCIIHTANNKFFKAGENTSAKGVISCLTDL